MGQQLGTPRNKWYLNCENEISEMASIFVSTLIHYSRRLILNITFEVMKL